MLRLSSLFGRYGLCERILDVIVVSKQQYEVVRGAMRVLK